MTKGDPPSANSGGGARRAAPALGRGLSALMGAAAPGYRETAPQDEGGISFKSVPVHAIHANPNQPRKTFEKDSLEGLAESIREMGVLQPVLVRPHPTRPGDFELIAGERRWQASQLAGLSALPCLIQDVENADSAERALTENLQRENLNPLEEANALYVLTENFGVRQEALARRIGKSRSYVANLLRLRSLPADVQDMVRDDVLSAGHARLLVGRPDAAELARGFVDDALSVRAAEKRMRQLEGRDKTEAGPDQVVSDGVFDMGPADEIGRNPDRDLGDAAFGLGQGTTIPGDALPDQDDSKEGLLVSPAPPFGPSPGFSGQASSGGSQSALVGGGDADRVAMETQLVNALGLKVDIVESNGKGRLVLHFSDLEQLSRLISLLEA